MLLGSESNAFRVQGLCVSCLGVMLFDVASIFQLTKVVLLQYFFDFILSKKAAAAAYIVVCDDFVSIHIKSFS